MGSSVGWGVKVQPLGPAPLTETGLTSYPARSHQNEKGVLLPRLGDSPLISLMEDPGLAPPKFFHSPLESHKCQNESLPMTKIWVFPQGTPFIALGLCQHTGLLGL